jgi:hypothetical protein
VWTYNYYDGWVPNYMFWIGVSHNAIGRFYETKSGGRRTVEHPGGQSREWYRPNPEPGRRPLELALEREHAAVGAAHHAQHVAKNKETFLENYYAKMKSQVNLGKTTAPYAYVIPADQRKKVRHRRSHQHRRARGRGRQRRVVSLQGRLPWT